MREPMQPISKLLERHETPDSPVLPDELRRLYGGDLRFPAPSDGRPYVIANFVSTLDGVVSFRMPGKAGGGDIGGFDDADRFVMGLLRASADAVMIGAGTLHDTDPAHLWTADSICPEAQDLYVRYRREVRGKSEPPMAVIVSASGRLDLERAVFRTPGTAALVITTEAGAERLQRPPASTVVRALGGRGLLTPARMLELLRADYGVRLLLHEGGPTLFAEFVGQHAIDELFLTVAPQLAGRSPERPRPGLIAGVEFLPETAPWLGLVSVRQRGDHLYLRYSLR